MSHKISIKAEVKQASSQVSQSKIQATRGKDEVPLISLKGYAINSADTAARMEKAQKALDEARRKIVLCK